jgi:hypothetical protein
MLTIFIRAVSKLSTSYVVTVSTMGEIGKVKWFVDDAPSEEKAHQVTKLDQLSVHVEKDKSRKITAVDTKGSIDLILNDKVVQSFLDAQKQYK